MTTHTPTASSGYALLSSSSSSWYVINEGDNAWGISQRLCDECNENPYDKIEIGVTEHYFCNDCHIKWQAQLPEELFEI